MRGALTSLLAARSLDRARRIALGVSRRAISRIADHHLPDPFAT